jgi:serine/threonine-protein kinase
MAPEQVAGDPVDARCDIYSLGCVLYELVTGSRPFEGSPVVVMGKQLREEAERPTLRAPNVRMPAELEAVIKKALAKEKEARFASAKEMREALQEALVAPDRRRTRGKRLVAFTLGCALTLIGAATFREQTFALRDKVMARFAPAAVAAVTVPVDALPSAPDAAEEPAAIATINAAMDPPPAAEPAPASEPAPAQAVTQAEPAQVAAKDEPKHEEAKKPSPLLVRASLHGRETPASLQDARNAARERPADPRALKALAQAAARAGELREARRAAEAWAVHDTGSEPRLFLAATLEASGRKREARAVLDEWLTNHPDHGEAKRMRERLGASPEPAIKRGGRGARSGRVNGRSSDRPVEE